MRGRSAYPPALAHVATSAAPARCRGGFCYGGVSGPMALVSTPMADVRSTAALTSSQGLSSAASCAPVDRALGPRATADPACMNKRGPLRKRIVRIRPPSDVRWNEAAGRNQTASTATTGARASGSAIAETWRENGRGERIRTSDPLAPSQVRCQTAPRPDRAASISRTGEPVVERGVCTGSRQLTTIGSIGAVPAGFTTWCGRVAQDGGIGEVEAVLTVFFPASFIGCNGRAI